MPRIDRLLALTDPLDLSQAVERYVHTLPAERVRALVSDAAPRMGTSYRAEFLRLLGRPQDEFSLAVAQSSDAAIRGTLARFLKSNLRAIPIFGSPFGLAVLEHAPVERAVGIGEETPNRGLRSAIIAGIAVVLMLLGAAGERLVVARSAPPSPEPVAVAMPSPQATPAPHASRRAVPRRRTIAAATAQPVRPATSAPQQVQVQAQAPVYDNPAPQAPAATPQPPPGKGIAVVTAPRPTPRPSQSDLDTTDMPEAYSDATPLPEPSAVSVSVGSGVRVATPKPSPKHHGWLHRSLMHLDPFKPSPRSTP